MYATAAPAGCAGTERMHVQPVVAGLQSSLLNLAGAARAEPAVHAALQQITEALGPALRLAATELAEQAAAEVGAQLPDHAVEVVLIDGDPTLRVLDAPPATGHVHPPPAEDLDARITLRLTPRLKHLVEDAAQLAGESVNAWVVDALATRTRR